MIGDIRDDAEFENFIERVTTAYAPLSLKQRRALRTVLENQRKLVFKSIKEYQEKENNEHHDKSMENV